MGYKCCVASCRSGYRPTSSISSVRKHISFFAFPRNTELRKKWTKACHRQHFEPTKYSRICSLHFEDNDFETLSSDTVTSRRSKFPVLKQRKLKPNAMPRIYPTLPERMQNLKAPSRSSSVSASARLAHANENISKLNDEALSRDNCVDFKDFVTKVHATSLPSKYVRIYHEKYVIFLLLANVDTNDSQPCVDASIKILENLDFIIFVNGLKVPNSEVAHLLKSKAVISSVTEISNILAFVKSFADISVPTAESEDLCKFLETFEKNPDDNLTSFVIEQLKIRSASQTGRRYSPNLIILAFIWHSLSPTLYRKLKDLFWLPSERRLQQISSRNDVPLNTMDMNYISFRTKDLSERDQIVTLIIDEIYTASRIEYHNGRFIGMTEEGSIAKTVLSFMVESVTSDYRDIVQLIAVDSLTSQHLRRYFDAVISRLDHFVHVIAVIVDNHAVNR